MIRAILPIEEGSGHSMIEVNHSSCALGFTF
jgi:hypothetical protein